ncbi:MAG TPA: TIGR00730 family Rossman fold protein [Haliscomenobacter sp.]|uniref:LOG family protein n=1 Tax=Haliscomenobacter sp. TaxID=2717303 RepID=UPI002B6271BE|nr:TIGR00730 family Rossman fold protein [Haliscomenobacter sp.]HOY20089.1 TIGR00730 family Rossman fold protein [Haliscomenobacter sp.]
MQALTVFCGANTGSDPVYTEVARQMGHLLASEGIALVYGGGKVGLMGVIADAVLEKGGKVIGVIPHFLAHKEVEHTGVTEMHYSETMHERKMKMFELSDGAIAMPGGFGTLDELFELCTWAQLGHHEKPLAILNVNGFYDTLLQFLNRVVSDGFLKIENRGIILDAAQPTEVLKKMRNYQPVHVPKWIRKEDI